ncbi:methyltransferase [Acinetobacter sp. TGL-Y2]|uniref:MGMT family protein n=1 Tax=Acinetobacter sp. TGL-Y2 TaxID=1407071 RepID=UPI0007A659E9|nr:MGMT family protein [Acinetobacter sp. TGL-Y2]AMW79473.1 methyltransferase [Acinetobacter sp. TGL-Y2]
MTTHNSSDELAQIILSTVALIPYGKVASYGQIAALAGLPRHARLVGRVLSQMDASSELPWHRVINAQGKISLSRLDDFGYNEQQARLIAEGVGIVNGKISFTKFGWHTE